MKSTEEIQEKLSERFPNLVLVEEYTGANNKTLIRCNDCGHEWKAIPRSVIASKHGCPKCGVGKAKREQAIQRFLDKLDKNLFEFIEYNSPEDVKVKCKKCNSIRHTTAENILKYGCKNCSVIKRANDDRLTTEEFIERSKKIHGDKYDYSKVEYINNKTKVCIICPEHGEFWQGAYKHIIGHNCPMCRESSGEEAIRLALLDSKIPFKKEKCMYIGDLKIRLDYYIEYNNKIYIIEYNGEQHYMPIDFFGGEEKFKKQQFRDKLLEDYCLNNNITLFVIKYSDNLQEKIKEYINKIAAL